MMTLAAAAPKFPEMLEALRRDWPTVVLSLLVTGFMFGMFVYAAVLFFMRLRRSWKYRWLSGIYLGAALPAGICGAVFSVLVFLHNPPEPGEQAAAMRPFMAFGMAIGGVIGLVIEVGKGLVYTGAGSRLAARLRQNAFAYLRGWLRWRRRLRGGSGPARSRRFPWGGTLLASAAVIGYTALLFWLTSPRISPLLKAILPNTEGIASPLALKLLTAWMVTLIAVKEEVVFRLFLQGAFETWLRRVEAGWLWAVLLSAGVWTLAHAGMTDPGWVKFAQIMPIGVLLGLMRRRWGLESVILVHVVLNLGAVFLLEGLCRQ